MTDRCIKGAVHWDVYEEPHPYDARKIVQERFGCCGGPDCHGATAKTTLEANSKTVTCGQYVVESVDRTVGM